MIYFDHGSTSYPKPKEVIEEIDYYINSICVNPGRGGFFKQELASLYIDNVRRETALLFGIENFNNLIFTSSTTHSINLALNGFLNPKDHVLICSYSHNSVIRCLENLNSSKNISYNFFHVLEDGSIPIDAFEKAIKPETTLVVLNHASNVLGVISEIEPAIILAKKRGIKILIDVAQTAGYIPLNNFLLDIDFIAGTAHKTLHGPSGVGFLYIKNTEIVSPLIFGGSFGNSSGSLLMPEISPMKYEAGTLNYMGIAGLFGAFKAAAKYPYLDQLKDALCITKYAIDRLSEIDELKILGTIDISKKLPIISIKFLKHIPKTIEEILDKKYHIISRAGLQCSPYCHKTLKTYPKGTLRLSFGPKNTKEEVDLFILALKEILNYR